MNPAYQGQVDVFCAAYAVINAMRHLHGSRLLACREILNEALMDAARSPLLFQAILNQQTDYVEWVDAMLYRLERRGSLRSSTLYTSFPGPDAPSPEDLYTQINQWLHKNGGRAVLFQFVRVLHPTEAVIRHWTCCHECKSDTLRLFDSSIEPGSLHEIHRDQIITDHNRDSPGKVIIVPYTIRLLHGFH